MMMMMLIMMMILGRKELDALIETDIWSILNLINLVEKVLP